MARARFSKTYSSSKAHKAHQAAVPVSTDVKMKDIPQSNEAMDMDMDVDMPEVSSSQGSSSDEPMDLDFDLDIPMFKLFLGPDTVLSEAMEIDEESFESSSPNQTPHPVAEWFELTDQIAYQLGRDPAKLNEMASHIRGGDSNMSQQKGLGNDRKVKISVRSRTGSIDLTIAVPESGSVDLVL